MDEEESSRGCQNATRVLATTSPKNLRMANAWRPLTHLEDNIGQQLPTTMGGDYGGRDVLDVVVLRRTSLYYIPMPQASLHNRDKLCC